MNGIDLAVGWLVVHLFLVALVAAAVALERLERRDDNETTR